MALSTIFLVLFIILSIIHVIGEFLEENLKIKIRVITKPFLLPLVVAYYFVSSNESGYDIVWLVAIGLMLGFVGDVVLMKPKVPALFITGLLSFLVGHVLYIIAFFRATNGFDGIPEAAYLSIIVYCGIFIVLFKFFKEYTKEMTLPVAVYMALILIMSFAALMVGFSVNTTPVKTPWLLFIASICFIASDFLLANQLFRKPFKFDQSIIMITYLVAQILIAQAYL